MNKQKGSALIYVILIVCALVATSLTLNIFVVSQVKQTSLAISNRQLELNAMLSVQQYVYEARKFNVLNSGNCNMPFPCSVSSSLSKSITLDLPVDEKVSATKLIEGLGTSANSITLSWQGEVGSQLKVVDWSSLSSDFSGAASSQSIYDVDLSGVGSASKRLDPFKNHKIEITALNSKANNLKIELFSAGEKVTMDDYVDLEVNVSNDLANKKLCAQFKKSAPEDGFVDYFKVGEEKFEE